MERLFALRKDLSISIKEFLSFKYNGANFQQKIIETANRKGTNIPSIANNNGSLLLHKSKGCQKLINNIVIKMEAYYSPFKKYIDIDVLGFSEHEIEVINNNPKIFFKCTAKRTLLVKWILDETEKYFTKSSAKTVHFWQLYDFLRSSFKTRTLNVNNLKKLFKIDNFLEYDEFIKIRDNLLEKNNKYLVPTNGIKKLESFDSHDFSSEIIIEKNSDKQFVKLPSNNQITRIIATMEKHFAIEQKYISLYNYFSSDEINIIDENPKIFFKCTPKKVVLVKWIVQEIERFFKSRNVSLILIDDLYNILRIHFKTPSFNKNNLKKLFKIDNFLWQNKFIKVKDNLLQEYNKFCNDNGDNDCFLKPQVSTSKRIFFQLFPELINNNPNELVPYIEQHPLSEEELEIKKILENAKQDLGNDLCLHFLNNLEESSNLLKIVSHQANLILNFITTKEAIENVDQSLLEARIKPLLLVYSSDPQIRDEIEKILEHNDIIFVKDLSKLLSVSTSLPITYRFIAFLYWLSDDKLSEIKKSFVNIFKDEKRLFILKMRAKGKTLGEIGQVYSLTRERIRQIEKRVILKFIYSFSRKKPHNILLAFSENDKVLTSEFIHSKLGDLSDVYIYCLKICNIKGVKWEEGLKGFIIGENDWYGQVLKHIEALPYNFHEDMLEEYIKKVWKEFDNKLEESIIYKLIHNNFRLLGTFYVKKTIKNKKTNIYSMVLEKYYQNGIKLNDPFEMMRFRNYIKHLFGDISLPEKDRAIWARITDVTILCGRGKYILPDRIKCDGELLNKIYRYIQKSPRNAIMFVELFEVFKRELLAKTNINNRYFLHGVLKYKFGNKLFFTRDAVVKDIKSKHNIRKSIEKFIRERGRIVTKEEILKEFKGITDVVFNNAISQNPNILLWNNKKYFHTKHLKIEPELKKRLKDILVNYINKEPISSKKIYDDIYSSEKNFLLTNKIYYHYALFSLLNYLFPNDFKFRRPFIAQKDFPKEITFNNILREYLSVYEEIDIADLQEYISSIGMGYKGISTILDNISDEFIRADEKMLIRNALLNLPIETIKEIEDITIALMRNTGFIVVNRLREYLLFPDIGIRWNPFLIVSVVKYYCKRLKIISKKVDYRYINEIIVDSRLNIDNYQHLLQYILHKEHKRMPFRNIKEIKDYLEEKGLIENEIPSILYTKGIIIKDKDGSITIN